MVNGIVSLISPSDLLLLVCSVVKNLPTMQETQVWSLGQENPLEKGMATHSNILAWRIPWTEEPGGLQSTGSQRVGHNWAINTHTHRNTKDFWVFILYPANLQNSLMSSSSSEDFWNLLDFLCRVPCHLQSDCFTCSSPISILLYIFLLHCCGFCYCLVIQLCLTLCDSLDCSMPGFPVHHQLRELAQTHVHRFSDAIQTSHPLSSPSPPAFNLSQCQGLFQWVSSSHQVVKVLEFQLQHQSFQWLFWTDFL